MSPAKVPSIKGLVFREFIRWYDETHRRERTMRAFTTLAPQQRAHLDPDRECFGVLAGSWYPIDVATGLLDAITWGLGPTEKSTLLRTGVEHSVRTTLTGVYRVLFRTLVTPERHAKYAQKIWDNYYSSGIVVGRMLAENRSEQWVSDWSGHHPLLCELSVWSLMAFHHHMGCKDVRVRRSQCVMDGKLSNRGGMRRSTSSGQLAAVRPPDSGVALGAFDERRASFRPPRPAASPSSGARAEGSAP